MTDYNGWTNRNTWLINLHFEGLLIGYQEDGEVTADLIQEIFLDHYELETKHLDASILDFIDISDINWEEIASHYSNEAAA